MSPPEPLDGILLFVYLASPWTPVPARKMKRYSRRVLGFRIWDAVVFQGR